MKTLRPTILYDKNDFDATDREEAMKNQADKRGNQNYFLSNDQIVLVHAEPTSIKLAFFEVKDAQGKGISNFKRGGYIYAKVTFRKLR